MNRQEIEAHLPIRTERMTLRVPTLDDVDMIQQAKERREVELRRWMSWSDDYGMSRAATHEYINNVHSNPASIPLIGVGRNDGRFIIATGLDAEAEDYSVISTGWWLADGYEGRGYAFEAMSALYHFMEAVIGARTVEAGFYAGNARSQNLMERLGMSYANSEPQSHTSHLTGERCDTIYYRRDF